MKNPITRFRDWLGASRFWLLIGVFVTTGILSFALSLAAPSVEITALQNALALGSLVCIIAILFQRMDSAQRRMWGAILFPAFGLIVLGFVILQQYQVAFLGFAFGWMVVGLLLFGQRQTPNQYRGAIKAMRKGNYKDAVAAMDDLIKLENDVPNHYRFRAELLRLWGKLGRARRDYETMIDISDDDANKAVAYNGLAEVDLQANKLDSAINAAKQAYDLAPAEWVAAYNLGMIQDRLGQSEQALDSLKKSLGAKVPDARHRLLINLYMVRAYARLNQLDAAHDTLSKLKAERKGLLEWQNILADDQAAVLREVLADDVTLAEKLIEGDVSIEQLVSQKASA